VYNILKGGNNMNLLDTPLTGDKGISIYIIIGVVAAAVVFFLFFTMRRK
jgi:LPXTG-motif cell wall-anchored protein